MYTHNTYLTVCWSAADELSALLLLLFFVRVGDGGEKSERDGERGRERDGESEREREKW